MRSGHVASKIAIGPPSDIQNTCAASSQQRLWQPSHRLRAGRGFHTQDRGSTDRFSACRTLSRHALPKPRKRFAYDAASR